MESEKMVQSVLEVWRRELEIETWKLEGKRELLAQLSGNAAVENLDLPTTVPVGDATVEQNKEPNPRRKTPKKSAAVVPKPQGFRGDSGRYAGAIRRIPAGEEFSVKQILGSLGVTDEDEIKTKWAAVYRVITLMRDNSEIEVKAKANGPNPATYARVG